MFRSLFGYLALGVGLAVVYILTDLIVKAANGGPLLWKDYGFLLLLVPAATLVIGTVADLFHRLRHGQWPAGGGLSLFSLSRFARGDQVMIRPEFTDLDLPGIEYGGVRGTVGFVTEDSVMVELESRFWESFDKSATGAIRQADRSFAIVDVPESALVPSRFEDDKERATHLYWQRWHDLFTPHLKLPLSAKIFENHETPDLPVGAALTVEELLEPDPESGLRCRVRLGEEQRELLLMDVEPVGGSQDLKDVFTYYHTFG